MKLLHKLLNLPTSKISQEDAIRFASEFCKEKELLLENPIAVEELRAWRILTSREIVGSPWILIDNQTGDILRFEIPPR